MDITDKRNSLYRGALLAAVIFALVSCVLMISLKSHEGYFDSHGRIAVRAKTAFNDQNEAAQNDVLKKNFPVHIADKPGAKLVIPFLTQAHKDKITVSEEFIQNKLVITLEDGASYIKEGTTLTSDSAWTEAVGVYQKDGDLVLEVYYKEPCGYQTTYENKTLTLSFFPLREQYDKVVVLYTPWENRNNLLLNEWKQTTRKLEQDYGIKIYSAISVKEQYSGDEAADFANRVHADMMIGMELVSAVTDGVVTVCNPAYFIPDFGNVELAALMEQEYAEKTGLAAAGFRDCEEQAWIKKSGVPTALTQLCIPQERQTAEETYTLNYHMLEAFGSVVKQTAETYWQQKEK